MNKARFFSLEKDQKENAVIHCTLCPHRCHIKNGGYGLCGVRQNSGGPILPCYGLVTALAEDPVEKKPLYHWRPGSTIVSAGFAGCNLRCPFCQNHHISRIGVPGKVPPGRRFLPEELIAAVKNGGTENGHGENGNMPNPDDMGNGGSHIPAAIAYTYSEPLVHAEFLLDCMKAARGAGIANVLVTNGCISGKAAQEILSLTDAVNVDLKSFSEKTYAQILGGDLLTVLEFIRLAVKAAVHTEITTLVVPDLNDSEKELSEIAAFILSLGEHSKQESAFPEIPPWHLSAYHPAWKWNVPPTDPAYLCAAAAAARKTLPHVYTGNTGEKNDTPCPHCGSVLIERRIYRINTKGLQGPGQFRAGEKQTCRCAACGMAVPVYG